jgi:cupin domain
MTPDVRELLPLYALGILEPDEVKTVERAIAADAGLASELAAFQQTAEGLVVSVAPPPSVKARLLASVGQGRFETFAERMTKLFDVGIDRAREFLGLIERPASWEVQPVPGIALVHFAGGPAYTAADCGFIRLGPGAFFPPHKHLGEEVAIILSGSVRDPVNNKLLVAGDDYQQAEGTEHYLWNDSKEDCIFAARAMNGIEVAGAPARPTRK